MDLGGRPMEEWIERYGHSHEHRFNRVCHAFGIPTIAVSLPLFVVALLLMAVPVVQLGQKIWPRQPTAFAGLKPTKGSPA